jgi:L-alanine-DL-glutamate epimerase-like enolase superfamily enzyme
MNGLTIADVSSKLYHLPPTVRWEDATHKVSMLEYVITTVTLENGLTGTGFAYTTGIGASAILSLIDDYCAAMLVGRPAEGVERNWAFLYRQLHRCGTGGINSLALGAIDIALWDLEAKRLGQPLHRLLGGVRDSVPAYGSGIDLFLELDELLEEVEEFLAEGFDTVKIKIGKPDPDEDAERVRAVQKLMGSGRRLLVDANQRWTAAEAIGHLAPLRNAGLAWIEEPLHAENVSGHADVRKMTGLPLAVGESLYTRHQFRDYLAADAVDIVQADVCRVGGFSEWLKIAQLASAYHRGMAPHYLAELSLAALCGIDNGIVLECVRGGSFSEMDLLETPLQLRNGVASPYTAPGHGIRFIPERLALFEVAPAKLHERNLESAK